MNEIPLINNRVAIKMSTNKKVFFNCRCLKVVGAGQISFFLLFLLLAALIDMPIVMAVQDKPCDKNLNSIQGKAGYKLRGSRCEGLYESPVSAKSLEIVSLLKGKLLFDLTPGINLEIFAADVIKGTVHVRAMGLAPKTYYRMDADLSLDQGPLIWPVDDVLLPTGLQANRIGIFGWVDQGTDKIFVPLRVIQQGKILRKQTNDPIELKVRSPVDIEKMVWRSFAKGNQHPESLKWQDVIQGSVSSGETVTIAPVYPTGDFYIEVAAKEQNSNNWLRLKIRVNHKGMP